MSLWVSSRTVAMCCAARQHNVRGWLVPVLVGLLAGFGTLLPAQEPEPRRTLHVISIGIDEYSGGFALRGAVNDATAFADSIAMVAAPLFDLNVVRLLDRQATQEAVRAAFQDVVRVARQDDVFALYFGGQGSWEIVQPYFILWGPEDLSIEPGFWQNLTPEIEARLIRPRLLQTWLNVLPVQSQLFVFDANRGADFFQELRQLDAAQRVAERHSLVPARTAMTVQGISFEDRTPEGVVHGALTYAFLQALTETREADGILWTSAVASRTNAYLEGHRSGRTRALVYQGGADFVIGASPPAVPRANALRDSAWVCTPPGRTPSFVPRSTVTCPELRVDDVELSVTITGTADSLDAGSLVFVNGRPAQLTGSTFQASIPLAEVGDEIQVRALKQGGQRAEHVVALPAMRSVEVAVGAAGGTATMARPGRSVALLFATNEYEYEQNLRNPIFDAQALQFELEQNYGFEVRLVRNATRQEMLDTLDQYASRPDAANDQLLVFFAGHGSFDQRFTQDGYIVARDTRPTAQDRFKDTAVQYNWIRRRLANATSRHVLLVLDVCYGGSFIERVSESSTRSTEDPLYRSVDVTTYLQRKAPLATRRYLTAGGLERVPDGRPGEHSPFTRRLLEVLRTYGGDKGFLTFAEIQAALQTVNPEPRAGGFERDEPGSDFVFVARQ